MGGAGRARSDARADLAAAAAAATGRGPGAAVERDAAFFRRVLPAVARATSWRNAACNAAQRQSYATVNLTLAIPLDLTLTSDPNPRPKQAAYPAMLEHAEYFESWIQVR